MRICDLKQKDVINECDCKILGCVHDVEFDCSSGCITALIIPGPGRVWGILGRDSEYIIPFRCIKCIGEDIILVTVITEEVLHKCKF